MDIPKIIHYCWFGNGPLDEKSRHCINSWREFFPDYEIIEWNENNFDISCCDFMQKAYDDKKWAFVSDVARLMIVYEHGGFYFDTDVEVIKTYEDILLEVDEGFMGFEKTGQVNSGLGFAASKNQPFLKELLQIYQDIDYEKYKNDLAEVACPVITTDLMSKYGLSIEGAKQKVCGLNIYPSEYFSPIDYYTGKMNRTKQTHSIHWYNASWQETEKKKHYKKVQFLNRLIGRKRSDILQGMVFCIKKEGIIGYIKKRAVKVIK